MKKTKTKIKLQKIEIDSETSEPKIVKIEADYTQPKPASVQEKNPESLKKNQSSIGKQLVMTRILGIQEFNSNIDTRQKVFKHIVTAVFLVFVVGVLGFTFYRDFFAPEVGKKAMSLPELFKQLSDTWSYFVYALIALFMTYFLKGLKLSVICRSQTKKWHFKTCFETGIIGHYYNCVTPLAVGGQPFEIYHLSKHGVHGGVAASMPIIAFFFYQFAFVALGITSLVLMNTNALSVQEAFLAELPAFNVLAAIGLVLCLTMPALVLTFAIFPRLAATLVRLFTKLGGKLRFLKNPKKTEYKTLKTVVHNSYCIKKFATNPLALVSTILISVAETLALCSIAYFTLKLFGYDNPDAHGFLEWLQIMQLSVILYSAISFIPTPGNSGAADLSFYLLFTIGVSFAGLSFTAMVLWRILSYYSFIIIGFLFTTFTRKTDHKIDFLGIADLEK
ncbi:MAG: flippase-like domain-containing protein [Clostridia bacterium]|nr:flippase-like domain-containing protein [Clostridia bacterium]